MYKKHSVFSVLLIYIALSLATLFSWHLTGINTVTGDEPHYLVIVKGILTHGSLEQTAPYLEEFRTRDIFKHGLAPEDAQPSPDNTHVVEGPNGLFNIHNIGLPALLVLPFMMGGIFGAKLFMTLTSALVIVVVWKFSAHFSDNFACRFWATLATAVAAPFIPASSQIYPDILAGLLALTGLYWFLTVQKNRTAGVEALLTAAIVFLPWLQIKFSATCMILISAVVAKIYLQSRDLGRIARILTISAISCLALAAYNHYAFGDASGPYQSGALEISKTSLMVLFGLHLDQNQGFLFQNPVFFVGILAAGWLYKFNRAFFLVWALVFLSLIVPNALHPAWYGGWSFSGRFQWAAAVVFTVPTIYGLICIARTHRAIFNAIILGGCIFQIYVFFQYAISGVNLYNKGAKSWFDSYSIFYQPLHSWLPKLYNWNWAYEYWINYPWIALSAALFFLGFIKNAYSRKTAATMAFLFVSFLVFASVSHTPPKDESTFKASQLPSQTGHPLHSSQRAEESADHAGFLTYGPYFLLKEGLYEVVFFYRSSAPSSEVIGWVDIFNATRGDQLLETPLHGTDDMPRELSVDFFSDHTQLNSFEFRTHWSGSFNIELQSIVVRKR